MSEIKTGDRIEMVKMENDPRPIEPGVKGTVTAVTALRLNQKTEHQLSVIWDNGRSLGVILPYDLVKKI